LISFTALLPFRVSLSEAGAGAFETCSRSHSWISAERVRN
jgi:hypothetical protein